MNFADPSDQGSAAYAEQMPSTTPTSTPLTLRADAAVAVTILHERLYDGMPAALELLRGGLGRFVAVVGATMGTAGLTDAARTDQVLVVHLPGSWT